VNPRRRTLLRAGFAALPAGALPASSGARSAGAPGDALLAPRPLQFPSDFGAHAQTRIEWWYLTGQLDAPVDATAGAAGWSPTIGLQLTFFRVRTAVAPDNPSRFAAHQLILAHAAIADPARGTLLHDERLAREGFGIAQAQAGDTHVAVDHWRLDRDGAGGRYAGSVQATGFAFAFTATPTQAILLQGERGYSRKGAGGTGPPAASFYYSEPQLELVAHLDIAGSRQMRRGTGWLDHEWSNSLLPPQAAGWDWGGYNLFDGSTLTFFRIRARQAGGAGTLHAYACLRAPDRAAQRYGTAQIDSAALSIWESPRTRLRYPVAQRLRIGARVFETQPLMNDQEYAARGGGELVYWEGASTLLENGRPIGRGYLELTGYGGAAPDAALGR